jgi:hypothetical protein
MNSEDSYFAAYERDLLDLEQSLTSLIAAILQQSDRAASVIVGVATSKLVAAGVVGGAFGAISAVGAASTGTAIATLSGAAATNATLYWIGSTFGMGIAGGGIILTGGALAVGIPAALYAKRKISGRPRNEMQLSPQEQALLFAALRLASPIRIAIFAKLPPTSLEMQVLSRTIIPQLVSSATSTYFVNEEAEKENNTCSNRPQRLAVLPKRKLLKSLSKMEKVARRWGEARVV